MAAGPERPVAPKTPALRLRLTAAAESAVRSGHPWVFANSVLSQNRDGQTGELAIIFDRQDKFLAIGLYDPDSPLRVRVLHSGKPQTLDLAWWRENLRSALERRAAVANDLTTGYRCINGESDHWPGLVLDRYGDTVVLKLYTAAWLPRLEEILRLITDHFHPTPARIVLRLSRNIQSAAKDLYDREDGALLLGPPPTQPVIFRETGLLFEADVIRGQKTGFFLDQRENRRRVETLASGCAVLNAFSFSGGFSLYAARGGARSVTDLDMSAHALESAVRNFKLNESLPSVAACAHRGIQCDVFEWLAQDRPQRFDLIILDPPSLAKRESEKPAALKAYGRLAALALNHLHDGGILVACSCSAHVHADEFFNKIKNSLQAAGAKFDLLETTFHAPDHPATFREAEYLKAIYLRMTSRARKRN